jgi:hypothetical protein
VVAVKLHDDDVQRDHFAKPVCQDAPWAVLFVAQCAVNATLNMSCQAILALHIETSSSIQVIFVVALALGIPEYRLAVSSMAEDDDEWEVGDTTTDSAAEGQGESSFENNNPLTAVLLMLGAAGFAGVASLVLFEQALRHPKGIIQFGLFGLVAMCSLLAVACVVGGSIAGSLLWTIFTLLTLCFVRSVQNRIPFAAANLSCAVAAIKRHKATVCVALQVLAYQVCLLPEREKRAKRQIDDATRGLIVD